MLQSFLVIASLLVSPAWSDELETVKISEVRPTQFSVGMYEVKLRLKAMAEAISEAKNGNKDKLNALLKEKPGAAVYGPPGKTLYLIDGHHFARALAEAGIDEMKVEIKEDFSDLSKKDFWKKMKKNKWTYLKDAEGIKRGRKELPRSIMELVDDPYRSLAYLVRKAGGYKNLAQPFQEFSWANYFRKRIKPFDAADEKSIEAAVNEGLALAASSDTKDLPGYIGKDAVTSCVLRNLIKKITK